MDRTEIERQIIEIVRRQKTLPDATIDPATPLTELGYDSLDALNIVFDLEQTFGIEITDDQAREIRTVELMVDAVEGLLRSK
jgi:acyl carrier protein